MLERMISRRNLFLHGAGTGAIFAVACSPAPPPAPPPAAPQPAKAAWEGQWDKLVADAKVEGKLSLITLPGEGYRRAADQFEQIFGGAIKVEHQSISSSSELIPKVTKEREAGLYSYDVAYFSIQSLLGTLKPIGVFDPIAPILIHPDATDDSKWFNGFTYGFCDKEKQYIYCSHADIFGQWWINTDLVKDSEIKSVRDLLDPKWKGKLLIADVRLGDTFPLMYALRKKAGDEIVKRLLIDQQPTFSRNPRQLTEDMVRGKFPIAVGIRKELLKEFLDQGQGKNLKYIDLPESRVVSGQGIWFFNRAPHHNAAKLFVNWFLTKEGSTIFTPAISWNARRKDVPVFDPDRLPKDGADYTWAQREEEVAGQTETRRWMEDLLK